MMKNHRIEFIFLFVLLIALSACQVAPVTETDTEAPGPPELPTPAAIKENNAGALEVVLSEAISTGPVNLTWTANGDAFWIEDQYTALLHDGETAMEIGRFVPGINSVIYDTSPDGRMIAYAVETDDIRLYDLENDNDTIIITTGFPYSSAFFSPDGKILAVPSLMDIKIVFFDTASGEEIGSAGGFSTAAPVYSAKYSPNGKMILWFSRGTVQLMEIATQEMGPVLSHEDFVTQTLVSPDGKVIATTAAGMIEGEFQPLLTLWNASDGSVLAQKALPNYYTAMSFSPDSELIAAGTENEMVIYTSPYGEEVGRYQTPEAIADIEFSPDGKRMAVVSEMGLLQMFAP